MLTPFSHSTITVLTCFQYASIVQDEIAEFHSADDIHKDRNNPNRELKDLYEKVAFAAENIYHKPLKDNKTAFLFEYKGREFFIGYYDGEYSLGLTCFVLGGNVIDFQHGIRHSTYIAQMEFNDSADVRLNIKEWA